MAEATVLVPDTGTKKAHFWDRSIGGNTVLDEFVLPGEFPYATYELQGAGISVATTADHGLQVMAGSTLPVRVRRIHVEQAALVTTADMLPLIVLRLTTAGTGGGAITARPTDSADAAAGCTGMTLPTVKGTEGVELFRRRLVLTQTLATSSSIVPQWEWVQCANCKPIIIPAGTANGIALKIGAGRAGAQVDINVEVVETNFV